MNFSHVRYLIVISLFFSSSSHAVVDSKLIEHCLNKVTNNDFCSYEGKSNVSFKGNAVFSNNVIQKVIKQCSSGDELSAVFVRQKISELYACAGYVTSGAELRTNGLNDYHYEIKEGEISRRTITVNSSGKKPVNEHEKNQIIGSILGNKSKRKLNINDLRRSLDKLKKSGQFKKIDTTVTPIPDKKGEANIQITVKQKNQYDWSVELSNGQSKAVGEEQFKLSGAIRGLRSLFDRLGASISLSEGSKGLTVFYTDSSNEKSSWSVIADRKESSIITEPLNVLDIKGVSNKLAFNYNYHYRDNLMTYGKTSVSDKLDWFSKVELIRTENYLLDRAFSFSEGEEEGKASIASLQTGISWEKKERSETHNYALAASIGVDIGVDALGSTKRSDASAGSEYKIIKGSAGFRTAVAEHGSFLANLNGQYSNDKLLAAKKVGLGGIGSVRGVDNNVTSFDSSIAMTVEASTLLPSLSKTPFDVQSVYDGNLYISAFADYAVGKDNRTSNKKSIGSLGIGTNWHLNKHTKFTTSWAKPVSFSGFDSQQESQLDNGRFDFSLIMQGGR